MHFSGSYVAIVTPWTDDGSAVDFGKLKDIVDFHVANGTDGLVPAGTTGESATLTHEEQRELIRRTVEFAAGRLKVVAGAGSNSTAESIALARHAADVGADGALVITPYYNKPAPEGLFRHFRAVAGACKIPVMLYNVPSRTGTNMLPPAVARAFDEIENVVSIKEASGSVDQTSEILRLCKIEVMSGDDSLTLPLMAVGGLGVVSVVANVIPAEVKAMVAAAAAGDYARAREIHYKILPVTKAMFLENNPMCVKSAMRLLGRLNGAVRLPLCETSPKTTDEIRKALTDFGLKVAR